MSATKYYAEVWRPNCEAAADSAYLTTFAEAFRWLMDHRATDASLHLRLITSEPILPDDDQMLRHFGVHLVEN
jgi:hypothetical protein